MTKGDRARDKRSAGIEETTVVPPRSYWEPFGQVIDQRWYDYGASADRERVKYGYDRDSNRTYRENTVAASAQDQLYGYDYLNRLTTYDRGDLNGTYDGMTGTIAKEEDYTLDPTGNWSGCQ
jgi:hypothetical protein